MEYETSPTMKYDGTGDVNPDDNQSEKNGSMGSGSEGSSEDFVKVEETMEDEEHGATSKKESPQVEEVEPIETSETAPSEIALMKCLDPREEISTPENTDPEPKAPIEPMGPEEPAIQPAVEEVEKPAASDPEPFSKPFDVSSLLSCSVGGVVDLIHWKDVKASAVTFGLSLLILLSLGCCSIVSVFSYLGLSLLTVTVSFRFYKFVIQTLNSTQQPNPFQSLLDADVTLSQEQVHKYTEMALSKVNTFIVTTRDLVLVKNVVASLKFGVFMWLLTHIGACFNGLTLLIVADILTFVLPPVYQKYQKQIDSYCSLACGKVSQVMAMARSYIPGGAKPKAE